MNFVLSERPIGTRSVLLALEGDTSPAAAQRVRERLAEVAARVDVGVVVVDLSPVSFVDSAVVEALCAAAREARAGGTRIVVVEPLDPQVAEPLQLGGVDVAAELVGRVEEAARLTGVPAERLKSAPPAPPPATGAAGRARRRMLGRRHQDQEILQELAQLRRMVRELSRTTAPPEPDGTGADPGIELEALRAQFDEARRQRDAAHREAAAARDDIAALRAEVETLRAQADTLRADADRMEDEAEQAHVYIEALEAENARLREQAATPRPRVATDPDVSARSSASTDTDGPETGPAAKPHEPEPEPSQAPEPKLEGPRPRVPVWADPRPINLNTADIDDLMLLPGIGRKPAERILAYRDQHGGFSSVDDLFAISEIPQDRLARIRPYVSV